MAEEYVQTNVNLSLEDDRMVNRMMIEDGLDNRSGFIRSLVRREWNRRYSRPNSGVSIAEAMEAGAAIDDDVPAGLTGSL